MRKSHPILDSVLKSRGAIFELIIATVALALAVNLLASFATDYFGSYTGAMLLASLLGIALSIAVIARRAIPSTQATRVFDGFFCYDQAQNRLISVDNYRYSEELVSFMRCLFAENEAVKRQWDADPISRTFEADTKAGTFKQRATAAGHLVIEATEYFVLDRLSTHLTDYFNQADIERERLCELSREDVASVVFKNRFLDTFSRPMQERAAFADSPAATGGEVCLSFGANGARFDSFDLVLPKNGRLNKASPTSIQLDAPKFSLKLEVQFSAFNTVMPRDFHRLYLGIGERVQDFSIAVVATVTLKPLSLFSKSGWEYHAWLDSFLESLDRDFSQSAFLERIDWDRASTVARMMKHANTPKLAPTGSALREVMPPASTEAAELENSDG